MMPSGIYNQQAKAARPPVNLRGMPQSMYGLEGAGGAAQMGEVQNPGARGGQGVMSAGAPMGQPASGAQQGGAANGFRAPPPQPQVRRDNPGIAIGKNVAQAVFGGATATSQQAATAATPTVAPLQKTGARNQKHDLKASAPRQATPVRLAGRFVGGRFLPNDADGREVARTYIEDLLSTPEGIEDYERRGEEAAGVVQNEYDRQARRFANQSAGMGVVGSGGFLRGLGDIAGLSAEAQIAARDEWAKRNEDAIRADRARKLQGILALAEGDRADEQFNRNDLLAILDEEIAALEAAVNSDPSSSNFERLKALREARDAVLTGKAPVPEAEGPTEPEYKATRSDVDGDGIPNEEDLDYQAPVEEAGYDLKTPKGRDQYEGDIYDEIMSIYDDLPDFNKGDMGIHFWRNVVERSRWAAMSGDARQIAVMAFLLGVNADAQSILDAIAPPNTPNDIMDARADTLRSWWFGRASKELGIPRNRIGHGRKGDGWEKE